MNFLKSMLLKALGIIPLNIVIGYILDIIEDFAKKTETEVDDQIVKFLRAVLKEVQITTNGVQLSASLMSAYEGMSVSGALRWFLDRLREMAEHTETDIDDEFVEFIQTFFVKYKLI